MIISTIDVTSPTTAYIFGEGDKPLEEVYNKASIFGNVSIVDILGAKQQGSNIETVMGLRARAGISTRISGGVPERQADILSWYRVGELAKSTCMVAVDCMLDGTVTKIGQQVMCDIPAQTVFEKFKNRHIFLTLVDGQGNKVPFSVLDKWIKSYDFKKLTIAGGVHSVEDVIKLDDLGIDCHVGAAIWRDEITPKNYLQKAMKPDLIPMCVQNKMGTVLGILYTNRDTLGLMAETRKLVAFSRSRNKVWIKDEKKGGVDVLSIRHNCNRDSLLVVVEDGKDDWCHLGRSSCFSI